MISIPCILFAGGKSSRMGSNKALLPFGGYTSLAHYQYDRLSRIFSHVYISAKNSDPFDFPAHFILDANTTDFAPTAGFVSAFEALKEQSIFVLSVDSPFVDQSIITRLLENHTLHNDATIAKTPSGTHPMVGFYNASLMDAFIQMQEHNDHRLGKLLSQRNTCYVEFDNEELFANLNHPHEYQEALSRYNNTKTIG
jgi:molybdopterin-guanine dinucleotide biosynthesis protein A